MSDTELSEAEEKALVQEAKESTDLSRLAVLDQMSSWTVRRALWDNPIVKALQEEARRSTDEARLSELASSPFSVVRYSVAKNTHAPVEVLTRLAEDSVNLVRKYVAENRRTPVEVLTRLADDPEKWVLKGLAANPSTPVEVLARLADDPRLRDAALVNPACPNELREASGMVFMFVLQRVDFRSDSFDMRVPESDFLKDLASAPVEVLYPSGPAPRFEIVLAGAEIEWTTDRWYDDHYYLVWCGGGAPDWWSDWSLIEDFLGTDAVGALARGDDSLFEDNEFREAERIAFTGHEATMEAWVQVREDLATMFAAGQRDESSSDTPPQELLAVVDRWLREDAWREPSEMAHRAIVSALARHPSTPVPLLEELAVSEHESVRWLVTRNPSATDEIRASAVLMGVDAGNFTGQIPDEDIGAYVDGVHICVDARALTPEEFAEEFPEMMDDPDSDWVTSDGQVAVDSRTGEIPEEIEEYIQEWFQNTDYTLGSVTELRPI